MAVDHANAYWKLTGFEYSNEQHQSRLTFSCYVSKAAADAGKNSMAIHVYTLTGDDYAMVNDLLTQSFKAQAYGFVKAKTESDGEPFFADAKDV